MQAGNEEPMKRFKSFAVIDLECSNFPSYNFNRVGITELSVYGFAAAELQVQKFDDATVDQGDNDNLNTTASIPKLPRLLHKLTLMINPRMRIALDAEQVSGLNNYMLEFESSFDENAANTFVGFLQHLQQPVCMVAHNGYHFDFPIIKYALEKINRTLPLEIFCLDSLKAFYDIDTIRTLKSCVQTANEIVPGESETEKFVSEAESIEKDFALQMQRKNETTPKRSTIENCNCTPVKRKYPQNEDAESLDRRFDSPSPVISNNLTAENGNSKRFKSRRSLFGKESNVTSSGKRYPPKGVYILSKMFVRIFKQEPLNAHHAEDDVLSLTRLILHYGTDFSEYAEENAIRFESIPRLGEKNDL